MSGYKGPTTFNCERALLTLLRGFGPLKDSVYLVGGLAPRYIVPQEDVPPHAGTMDVDLVIDFELLMSAEAYATLEANLERMGFECHRDANKGPFKIWQWMKEVEGAQIYVDFLTEDKALGAAAVKPVPEEEGVVGALNVPHASLVLDMHGEVEIFGELLDDNGRSTETVRYANLVSFTVLKARAFEQRFERKDAYDLFYCLENYPGGLVKAVELFVEALQGVHQEAVREALVLIDKGFIGPVVAESHKMNGPIAVANFEIEGNGHSERERKSVRQRVVAALINEFLAAVHAAEKASTVTNVIETDIVA